MKKGEEALAEVKIALKLKSYCAEAYFLKGNIYMGFKKVYLEVLHNYDLALKYKPNYPNVFLSKSVIYTDFLTDYNKAIEQCDLAIKSEPDNAAGYSLKANVLAKLGRTQESHIMLEKAEKLLK